MKRATEMPTQKPKKLTTEQMDCRQCGKKHSLPDGHAGQS